jgi:hypothetical protein
VEQLSQHLGNKLNSQRQEVDCLDSRVKIRKDHFLGEILPLNQILSLDNLQLLPSKALGVYLAKVQPNRPRILCSEVQAQLHSSQQQVGEDCLEASLRVYLVEMRQLRMLDSPLTRVRQ